MTAAEAIKNRRSIRKYKKGAEVSDGQIEEILTAAMMAPSAGNSRPWEFIVLKDRKKLEAIMAIHPHTKMLETASLAILVCGLPPDPAGHLAQFMPQDCGAASQNILLKAFELGLGTCWCGVYPIQERVDKISALLKDVLSPGSIPFNVIAVGVPDENPQARGKFEKVRVKTA
ncbi:MAG: nitroreductase family protein [Treponema sp.]|jgi:nitroreductase|nr:nitroreductase family protein [Treponema sp.]